MRNIHRWIMTVAAVFLAYLALSGLLIQGVDLLALLRPSARNAPDLRSIKEYAAGPPYFSILSSVDETAATLPNAELPQMLTTAFAAARSAEPSAPITSIELRMAGVVSEAVVSLGTEPSRELIFNARTGEPIAPPPPDPLANVQSTHDAIKDWHRGNIVGIYGIWLNLLMGLALVSLAITGLVVYLNMHTQRKQTGRRGLFWR